MHPLICAIGPVNLYAWGMMLAIAFVVCSTLAGWQARAQGIDPDIIYTLSFCAVIFGVIGARILYVVSNLGYYLKNPLEIIMLQEGGLSWFGGMVLGTLASVLYVKRTSQPLGAIMDIMAPFIALGQSIGRIGCLLNGCCYGRESAYGLFFPVHDKMLIPTQLYSSLGLLAIYIILRRQQEQPHRRGQVFVLYLILYSVSRFFIEFWRGDNPRIVAGLTLFQLLSIFLFVIAAYAWYRLHRLKA